MSKPKSPDANSLAARRLNSNAAKDRRAGILPNFVFLQLYQMGVLHSSNVPVPIPDNNEARFYLDKQIIYMYHVFISVSLTMCSSYIASG